MGGFENDAERAADESTGTTNRRGVLRALGGASALVTLGGANASAADASTTGARTPEEARSRARQGGRIDPVWGFPALSEDTDPPVDPDHEVELRIRPRDAPLPEFFFEPTGLYVESGDTVKFFAETPHHTVTAYHPAFGYVQRVPDDVPPFSAPVLSAGGYWLYTFDQPGVYELHCAPHEVYGHAMRIVVGEVSGPAADPLVDLCTAGSQIGDDDADDDDGTTGDDDTGDDGGDDSGGEEAPALPRLTAYTVLRDSALAPENVVSEGRVSWDELADESKRLFVEIDDFPPCATDDDDADDDSDDANTDDDTDDDGAGDDDTDDDSDDGADDTTSDDDGDDSGDDTGGDDDSDDGGTGGDDSGNDDDSDDDTDDT